MAKGHSSRGTKRERLRGTWVLTGTHQLARAAEAWDRLGLGARLRGAEQG